MHKFILICLVLPFGVQPQHDPKLNVMILFESLCPDSLRFIKEQLVPAWKDLSPYVNLKLVPFGKSSSIEGAQFVCQHGPQECKGNKIMSCAFQRLNINAQVHFVDCFMDLFRRGRNDENEYGEKCARSVPVDFQDLINCYNSQEGTNLQLAAERATLSYRPRFIPTIIYNGEFNQELQDNSLTDFRGTVCNFIKDIYPESCKYSSVLAL